MIEVRPKYQPHIDGLRAVAVLSVLGYHAFPSLVPGGFVGVDVFFVISGFLISKILFAEFSAPGSSGIRLIANFYSRRVRRIFPSLIVVLAVSCVLGYITLLPSEFKTLGLDVTSSAAFCANFAFARETGYFSGDPQSHPLLHLWSLGVEEQFYLLWPMLIWISARFRMRFLTVVLFLGACSYFWNAEKTGAIEAAAFFLPQMRMWELLIGSLAALASMDRPASEHRAVNSIFRVLPYVGGALIVCGLALITRKPSWPNSLALLPTVGAAFVLCSDAQAWGNRRLLAHPVMVGIGLVSYPLYLWHWPLLCFARIGLENGDSFLVRITCLALAGLLAWLTTRFIENPIRHGGSVSLKVGALLAAMAAAAVAGAFIDRREGFPGRFPPIIEAISSFKYDTDRLWRTGSYFLTGAGDDRHFKMDPAEIDGAKPSLVLWGDSHAAALYPGIKKIFGGKYNVLQRTMAGVPPFMDATVTAGSSNAALNLEVMATIRALHPAYVVIESNWVAFGWKSVESTILAVKAAGAGHVILVGPVPQWQVSLPQQICNFVRHHRSEPVPFRLTTGIRPEPQEIDRQMNSLAERLGVQYVSPCAIFGDQDGFLIRLGDTPDTFVTYDYGHLTEAGSLYLASHFPKF